MSPAHGSTSMTAPASTRHRHRTPFSQRYPNRLRTHHDALKPLQGLTAGMASLHDRLGRPAADSNLRTIYVHVPFCGKICHFCNLRRMRRSPAEGYAALLLQDMAQLARYPYVSDGHYGAIYFGGGTPTTLTAEDLQRILVGLRRHFQLTEDVEITLESSVSDLTEDKLRACMDAGVNRASLGVQTFADSGRTLLGRSGSGLQVAERIQRLRELGLDNLGVDLIYHYPGQTLNDLATDLEFVTELDLAGFSFYALMLRENSRLARVHPEYAVQTAESLQREWNLFESIIENATIHGFDLLELTKLVRSKRDRYRYVRLRYRGGDTLPLGAGAGGHLAGAMLMNPLSIKDYRQAVAEREGRYGLAFREPYRDLYRFVGGVQFGEVDVGQLPESCRKPVARLCAERVTDGLLVPRTPQRWALTTSGVFWGNNLASELAASALSTWVEDRPSARTQDWQPPDHGKTAGR